ncbi:MAG TPA: hypothetical protein VFB91_07845 [Terriglobales bacterium]|nr:hypothetical protein [Terriglobales bacterium]
MIVECVACSAQNFVSAERLAVREIPPRCWECGRPLPIAARDAGTERKTVRETGGFDPESNGNT